MMKLKPKVILSIGFVSILFIASYIRMYFGVDFQDESFYITIPYRFILGDKFIINESSICQFAGILLYPFYKLFYNIHHDSQGIVLYGRHLYFFFYTLLSCLTFAVLRKELGKCSALILSSICILYVPYNIMALSYNTLAMLFYTAAGLLTLLDWQRKTNDRWRLILAGFFYSLSVFCYPPLVIPVGIATLLAANTIGVRRALVNIFLGALPILLLLIFILISYHQELINIYHYSQYTGHTNRDISVLFSLMKSFVGYLFFLKTILFFSLGITVYNFRHLLSNNVPSVFKTIINIWGLASLILLPLSFILGYLLAFMSHFETTYLITLMVYLSVIAPLYFNLTNKPNFAKKMFVLIWLPSFAAGVITAFVSATQFANATVGLAPAFLVSAVLVYLALKKNFNDDLPEGLKLKYFLKILPTLYLVVLIAAIMVFKFGMVVRDYPIKILNSQVTVGPYKNIFTHSGRAVLLNQFNDDIGIINQTYHPKTVIIYPTIFGFYLTSNLKPLTNSTWIEARKDNHLTLEYFEHIGQKPQLAVVINNLVNKPADQLFEFLSSNEYSKLLDRGAYSIYILKSILDSTL